MVADLTGRSPQAVFDDHLRLAQQRDFDEDITRNYAPDCIVLTGRGAFQGHEGLRALARQLEQELPTGEWHYRVRLVEGNVAYLEWSADADGAVVDDGADSFFVVDGRIVAQTIHYTVRSPGGYILIGPDGNRPSVDEGPRNQGQDEQPAGGRLGKPDSEKPGLTPHEGLEERQQGRGGDMATTKQVKAAKRNIKKARAGAEKKRTIAHMPAKTRTALGKQGAAVAARKRSGGSTPKTRQELYDEARRRDLPGRSKMGRDELARALGHE